MAFAIDARSAIGRNTTPNIIRKSTKHGQNGIGQRLLHGQGTRSRQHRSKPPYDHRIKRLRVVKIRKIRKRPGRGSPPLVAHALVEPRPRWNHGAAMQTPANRATIWYQCTKNALRRSRQRPCMHWRRPTRTPLSSSQRVSSKARQRVFWCCRACQS